jgi:PKD repeat protein
MSADLRALFLTKYPVSAGTTIYVDGVNGNDAAAGATGTPKQTIAAGLAAITNGQGGKVLVRNGTYAKQQIAGRNGASVSNWVHIMADVGHSPKIAAATDAPLIDVQTSTYLGFFGLEFAGVPITSGANDEEGIQVWMESHHISVWNCFAHDLGSTAIVSFEAGAPAGEGGPNHIDFCYNTVAHTAYWSYYDVSGISIQAPKNSLGGGNDSDGYSNRIIGNVLYGVENKVGLDSSVGGNGTIEGGHGIFVAYGNGSSAGAYTGATMVANNLVVDCGGDGIRVYNQKNVGIYFNTAVENNRSAAITDGQVVVSDGGGGVTGDTGDGNIIAARTGVALWKSLDGAASIGNSVVLRGTSPALAGSDVDKRTPGPSGYFNTYNLAMTSVIGWRPTSAQLQRKDPGSTIRAALASWPDAALELRPPGTNFWAYGALEPIGLTTPAAAFTASPGSPTAGQTVTFTDGTANNPTSWSWTFGDGATSTAQSPMHAYAGAGTYTVTLIATNGAGSSTVAHTVTVASAGAAPVAAFTQSPNPSVLAQTVQFTDTSPNFPTAWAWIFGDSSGQGLYDSGHREVAYELLSSAENSSLNWRAQYSYIQDIGDGRGYTGGVGGFCSGTGDMLQVVERYMVLKPSGNGLAAYHTALVSVNGSSSHTGLGAPFTSAWVAACSDPLFLQAQDEIRDTLYFRPAVDQAIADGLGALGQFCYFDHSILNGFDGMINGIRTPVINGGGLPPGTPSVPSGAKNATSYGAVGNGVADDTAALQACFDAAQTAGTAAYLPAGVYLISATLNYGPIIICGDSSSTTTIKNTTTRSDPAYTVMMQPKTTGLTGVQVRDLTFDQRADIYDPAGQEESHNALLMSVDATQGMIVRRCNFRNVRTMAIWCDSDVSAPTSGLKVLNNSVYQSKGDGFSFFGSHDNFTISGNTITDTKDDGIAVQDRGAGYPNNITITYNTISNLITTGVNGSTARGILCFGGRNCLVQYNTITNTLASCIQVGIGGTYRGQDIQVLNNKVSGAGTNAYLVPGVQTHGIFIIGADRVTVNANKISNTLNGGYDFYIYASPGATAVVSDVSNLHTGGFTPPGNPVIGTGGTLPPSQGGDESTYLLAWLNQAIVQMDTDPAHSDHSRVIAQKKFLSEGKLQLELPLAWTTYGDPYTITTVTPPYGASDSTLQNPTHAYASAGTYAVRLTATNASGSSSITHSQTVNAGGVAPAAAFTASPSPAVTGQNVVFTDSSLNTPTSWAWNFGDSSTSALQNPTHAYASARTYTVTLTATNATGNTSLSKTLSVTSAASGPVAQFSISPNPAVPGQAVSFTDTSTGLALGGTHAIIKHGNDIQNPTQIAANFSYIETLPFDGMTISLGSVSTGVFSASSLSLASIRSALDPIVGLTFNRLKRRFAITYADAPSGTDSVAPSAGWTTTAANWGNLAQVCNERGLRGIFFDNESYFTSVWAGAKDWVNAYDRGKACMAAAIAAFPTIEVIVPYGSWVSDQYSAGVFNAAGIAVNDVSYANWNMGPFFAGMVGASIGTAAKVYDGSEVSYTARTAGHFDAIKQYVKYDVVNSAGATFIPSGDRASYPAYTHEAFATYNETYQGQTMDSTIWEAVIKLALARCEDYVWLYTEPGTTSWWVPAGSGGVATQWITATANARAYGGSLPGSASWAWNFGDGSTSSAQNPTHAYGSPGTYTVTLTATNANGSNSISHTVTVTAPITSTRYEAEGATLGAPAAGVYTAPTSGPGSLVTSSSGGSLSGGTVRHFTYRMTSYTGSTISAVAHAVIPTGTAPAGGRPVIAALHGAAGLCDTCGGGISDSSAGIDLSAAISAGYVVVFVDNEGLGGEPNWPQPYINRHSAGRGVIDACRAIGAYTPISGRCCAWGWSQGGHTALSAGEMHRSGYGNLNEMICVAVEPVMVLDYVSGTYSFDPYPVAICYGAWLESQSTPLNQIFNGGAVSIIQSGAFESADLNSMPVGPGDFITDPTTPTAWRNLLRANDLGYAVSNKVMLLAATGGLGLSMMTAYRSRAQALGTPVTYQTMNTDHVGAPGLSPPIAQPWVNANIGSNGSSAPTVTTAVAGYSGTGYVTGFNAPAQYVQFAITAPAAGPYDLSFGFRLGAAGATRVMTIDGNAAGTVSFASGTAAWGVTGNTRVTLAAGSHTVRVAATDTTNVLLDYLLVAPAVASTPPVPAFTFSPDPATVSVPVQFTDASTGATSWLWNFGDGTTAGTQSPAHAFPTTGSKVVTLTTTNANGSASVSHTVVVNSATPIGPVPVGNFTISPNPVVGGATVTFTDSSTQTPTSWLWTFGDGATSTSQNPTHAFGDPGTHSVTLVATNANGSGAPVSKTMTVLAGAPIASFTQSPSPSLVAQTVQFSDTSSGGPAAWFWDLGDETLILSDSFTAADGSSPANWGNAHQTAGALADIQSNQLRLTTGTVANGTAAVRLNAAATSAVEIIGDVIVPAGSLTDWTVYVSARGSTTFDVGLIGAVALKFSPYSGLASLVRIVSAGNETQLATPVALPASLVAGDIIHFRFRLAGDIAQARFWKNATSDSGTWTLVGLDTTATGTNVALSVKGGADTTTDDVRFDNLVVRTPSTSTLQNPSHAYGSAGGFTVTLTVTNAAGRSTLSQTQTVSGGTATGTCGFTSSPAGPQSGVAVTFTDTSTGTNTAWSWQVRSSANVLVGSATTKDATFTLPYPDTFTVIHTANGCAAPIAHTVTAVGAASTAPHAII